MTEKALTELLTPYRASKTFQNDENVEMVSIVDCMGVWVFDCFKNDANEILRRLNLRSQNNYPESLIRRNEQLERALKIHKEVIESHEDYEHKLRFDLNILGQKMTPDEVSGKEFWYWQHDGYDFLRSMRNDQAILISAEDLRDLLKNGEKVAE